MEYRAQLDAERALKLAKGKNHAGMKEKLKKKGGFLLFRSVPSKFSELIFFFQKRKREGKIKRKYVFSFFNLFLSVLIVLL